MVPRQCKVIREKETKEIPAADLVPGDVVFVQLGDKVPADIRLFHVSDMKVDNSSLTGESEPQDRTTSNTMNNPLEASNIGFNGTLCVSGEGYGIVVKTGDETVLGHIACLTAGEKKQPSPLSLEINRFVKFFSIVAVITMILFFLIGWKVMNKSISSNLIFAIGLFISWIPEGLPATVTVIHICLFLRISVW
jgi:sodium/potassium-transporting ATPase subunit alpha